MEETIPALDEYQGKMDRPIPGQSLTEDPDIRQPYESATEFTVAQEAVDYVFATMTEEENYVPLMESILEGSTVMEATKVILFSGFNEGKWNPDLMLLLMEPIAYMIMGLAERVGIDYVVQEDDEEEAFGVTIQRPELADPSELSEETQDVMEKVETVELPELQKDSMLARPPPEAPPSEAPPSLMQRQ
jgi:hypothetical protein